MNIRWKHESLVLIGAGVFLYPFRDSCEIGRRPLQRRGMIDVPLYPCNQEEEEMGYDGFSM